MSKSRKNDKPLKVYSVNPQDIDLNKAAEFFYHYLMNHPEILKEAEEELKKEKEKKEPGTLGSYCI